MDSVANIIVYAVCALIVVIFSIATVVSRRILRSATYLLFVLIGTAVIYFQLGYQFLGAVQIAVYAGGIMVLFVFSILLTRRPDDVAPMIDSHKRALGATVAVLGAALLIAALVTMPVLNGESLLTCLQSGKEITMNEIGNTLMGTEKFQYLLPFEAISVLLLGCIIGGVTVARKR